MKTPSLVSSLQLFVFSATISLLLPSALVAQTTAARPDRGIMPGASYSVSDIENISLTNGNLQLTIPLASLPPMAGGKLKFTVNAVYNSKLWNITRQESRLGQFYGCPSWVVDTPQLSDLGGWRIAVGYQIVFRDAHEDFDYVMPEQPPTPDCETDVQEQARLQSHYYRAILISPDGAEHELRPTDTYAKYGGTRSYLLNYYKDTPNTVGSAMRYYSFDGSYLYAVINPSSHSTSWTIYMNDGTRIVQYSNGIQRITDTNGNSIKIFSDASGTHIQDEHTGREIRLSDNKVWYETVTGLAQSIDIVMGTTQVQGKIYQVNDWSPTGGETGGGFVCTRNNVLTTEVPVIREIVFPATEPGLPAPRYSFGYNSDTTSTATDDWRLGCGMALEPYTRTVSNGMGELSQVVSPSGAVVKYSYSKSSVHNFSMDSNEIPRATVTQKQIIHDGITDTWTYNITEFAGCGGVVTAPDGSVTTETCYPHDPAWAQFFGYESNKGGLVYRSSRSNKEIVERHWTTLPFSGANIDIAGAFGLATFNPVVDVEYVTHLDDTPNHNPIKMSARKFQYDFNGNLIQQIDYDWFDPSLVSRDTAGVPTGVPASATVLRTTNHSHYNQAATASSTNVYAKRSLNTVTPLILNASRETTVGSGIVRFSYDGQAFDVAPTVGNLTTKKVWDNVGTKWITTSSTYDVYGNVVSTTDARGNVTEYFFDDDTHALPTRVVVDPQNGTGTQTTTTGYDNVTGLVTSITDPNGATSTISYTNQLLGTIDPFGRPGVTTSAQVNANGVNQHRRVTTTYEDHLRRVVVASDLNAEDDKLLKSRTTADMLGRPILMEQTEDGTNYTLYSQQRYEQGGRISFASSVMRTGGASNTDSWTRVTNDNLGRATEVATFGGATQPPNSGTTSTATGTVTTVYDANFTTITDQSGKLRRSMVDALGRLIRVDEPDSSNNLGSTAAPVQPTSYNYDVFGNLTTVTQGPQTRTFTYDSLSRLRQATNPESGTVNYQYDDNGNLLVKTDARTDPNDSNKKVSTHFEYDALNRLTRRWYNGSTSVTATTHNNPSLPPGVGVTDEAKFKYDSALTTSGAPTYSAGSAKGRLVAQTYGTGTNGDYYAYDALGRVTLKIQQTGTVNYQLSASYNLAGATSTLTYPSGHSVTNTFDQAGRLAALSGSLGDGANRTYATGILYAATGGLVKEQFGTTTAVYNKLAYNSRGQLAEIRFSTSYTGPADLDWNRGAIINSYSDQCTGICALSSMTDNNGNLRKQEIYIPGDDQLSTHTMRRQQYDYDSLNRLNWVREVLNGTEQWRQWFKYDRWGNRTIDTTVENGQTRTYGTGINSKAFAVAPCSNSSDPCSNRLLVPAGQSGTMAYDAAGNLTNDTYTGAGNRTYDAENKITSAWGGNNQAQTYKYDASGQRISRTVNGVETWQVYGFGGELVAEYAANATAESPQKEYGYRNGQLLITAETAPPQSAAAPPVQLGVNVAAASNGAVATASSSVSTFVSSKANNGDRVGTGGWWADDTPNAWADWIQVEFAGSRVISEIDVFGLQQNPGSPVEPTETMTSSYALTDFEVRYWNGSDWATVPGGSVTGNIKVWRKFVFAPLTTSKIQVRVTAVAGDNRSQVVEIEAYGPPNLASGASGAVATASSTVNPFVASNAINGDHVGTGGFWADDTPNAWADWIQVEFAGARVISEIDVFGLQQNYSSPVEPTATMTSSYALTDFEVRYWNGGDWAMVPGGSVSGNNKVWRRFTFAPLTTNKIQVRVTAVAGDNRSEVVEIEAYGPPNVALAASGAVATASSAVSTFVASKANNGDHVGAAGWWADDTPNAWADWIQVEFAGERTISEIDVFGLQQNYSSPVEPSTTMTSSYALTDFEVRYWDGSDWATVPGGRVVGNDKVWRRFTFAPLTTKKIQVYVTRVVGDNRSQVVEIEAYATTASDASIQWLVTDQLGTPRMIIDQTGTLGGVKRHDYLPFGEELFAGIGGRSAENGYGCLPAQQVCTGDKVRQQFTQKERDVETGLDYFLARYYSSTQGRFTGVDPFNIALETQKAAELNPEKARALFNAYLSQPQQWNRYSYAINNPLLYVDPDGEAIQLSNDKDERERQLQALREMVGSNAGAYLYANQGSDGNWYVGIYDQHPNGDTRSFEQVNEVAGELGAIVRDKEIAVLEFVPRGTRVTDDSGDWARIVEARRGAYRESPAATGYFNGVLKIKMLDWSKHSLGYLPGELMSDRKDNWLTASVMVGHELGHARARMTGYRDRRGNSDAIKGSLRLEDKVRKLQNPNGPRRERH